MESSCPGHKVSGGKPAVVAKRSRERRFLWDCGLTDYLRGTMHVLIWIACAAGCGVLWIVQELVGSMIAEGFCALVKWLLSPILSPVGRCMSRLLVGAQGVAWFYALALAGLLGLGGGLRGFFAALLDPPSLDACLVALAAAGVSAGMLLWLDSVQDAATAERRRLHAVRQASTEPPGGHDSVDSVDSV